MNLFAALAMTAALTCIMLPILLRSGVGKSLRSEVRPNNLRTTPQIGGIAVVPVALAAFLLIATPDRYSLPIAAGAALLFALGLLDDLRPLPWRWKFAAQWIAALAFVAWAELTPVAPGLPEWLEGLAAAFLIVWFVNMTNFMDGMDLMTASGFGIPLAFGGAILLAVSRQDAGETGVLALLLVAALGGFLPFNLPPARIYLGDSGALALGFAGGATVVELAATIGWAALMPFSYYLADSLSTLALRAIRREPLWKAHQRQAYQSALARGWSPWTVAAVVAGQCVLSGALCLLYTRGIAPPLPAAAATAALAIGVVALLRSVPGRREPRP